MNGGQSNMPSGVADSRHSMAATSSPQTSWLKDVSVNPILARETGVFRPGASNIAEFRQYSSFLSANPGLLLNPMMPGLPSHPSSTPSSSASEQRSITTLAHSERQVSRHNTPSHSPVPGASYRNAPRSAEPTPVPLKRPRYDSNTTGPSNIKNEVSSIPHRPDYFHKGSIIQLADTNMKRIEDLKTTDFESSAYLSPNLALDCSSVVEIKEDGARGTALITFAVGDPNRTEPIKATVEATFEHPFFVYNQGWCSISPTHTHRFYQLGCQKLRIGDRCVSLTYSEKPGPSGLHARGNGQTRGNDKN